jgi:acetate kinase
MNVLSINSGSSSLKVGRYVVEGDEARIVYTGEAEGIGSEKSHTSIKDGEGKLLRESTSRVPDQEKAFAELAGMHRTLSMAQPDAAGHRVVHGGPKLREHQRITPDVMRELEAAEVFAPLHVPNALKLIHLAEENFPGVPQFACFDTAFHRTLPEAAARFALPEKFWGAGVRRYGFHGLSCESILHQLGAKVPAKMVVAHLGSGASVTAIARSASVDTTMGLTPTGGIVMATRTGDLDPGVMLHILRTSGGSAGELERLVDKESGLRGVSGRAGGMRELREHPDDPRARMAIEIFCRSVKKAIGSFVAVLGGLDMLVFAGGIGENDPASRAQICAGMDALGIVLDEAANQSGGPAISAEISAKGSKAEVRVIPSDEDEQIARITGRLAKDVCQ